MIVKEKPVKTTIINTDQPFEQIKTVWNYDRCDGKFSRMKRVIFTRYIGIQKDEQNYIDTLAQIDREIRTLHVGYLRLEEGLYNGFSQNNIQKMEQVWNEYLTMESQNPNDFSHLYKLNMGYRIKENSLEWTKKVLFKEIITLFDQNNGSKGYSARKNFAIKFLMWMNIYLKELFDDYFDFNYIPKVIYYGEIKKHEQYFLLFLSKMGCDVLYMNPKEDMKELLPQIKDISVLIRQPHSTQSIIKWPKPEEPNKKAYDKEHKLITNTFTPAEEKQPNMNLNPSNDNTSINSKSEKNYEELAQLAKSVVLINVYNDKKELLGRGSGVAVTTDGFILTNFHVIQNGVVFGILFENNENEYFTNRLVKYHQEYDLALLKIDRSTEPLLINPQEKLVRGQKIVAIGSPLGLFNTISDGIISGFRDFGDIEVLQITAPISPGSSGGALLDLYGNLIGITTAGFEGQNLNLAVGTKYIKLFAGEIITLVG
ncbi:trypsin-like peptidase [Bacillus oleivorans]|uniref:Trypsin-like peptidase n=1 Tax=Bacillus oleivorans TaxID=1448271 RepID=A0A285CTK7_9BACI|nr:YceG family protein [Bacillus oleivorans]SNX70900.1 trypsin-like peptidase [Bacillus oleivorans]